MSWATRTGSTAGRAAGFIAPCSIALCSIALSFAAGATPAAAQPRSSELICTIAGGFGLVVVGQQGTVCVYYRADGNVEFYTGSSTKVGFDIGPSNAQRLAFQVTGVDPAQPAALQGAFAGPAAGASIGFGLSGEALVGGANGRAVLVPITNQSYSGLNITAALGTFTLHYAGREPRAVRERY